MAETGEGPKSRITMKDVALAAGVSQSTVSFVLNGSEDMRISHGTRKRVLAAAEELAEIAGRTGRDAPTVIT